MPRARYVPAKQNGRHLLDEAGYKYRIMKARTQKTYVSPTYGKTSQIIANTYAINFLELKTQLKF